MSHCFSRKERPWLEIQEAHYRFWIYEFFKALIGRHPFLYPAIGVLRGLAMLLLALLLFSAVHRVFRYVAFLLISLGAIFLVFSAWLIGLVDWAWNQTPLFFHQR